MGADGPWYRYFPQVDTGNLERRRADKNRFPELHALILDRCRGVNAVNIWIFLKGLSIRKRRKQDRLRLLTLSGCRRIDLVNSFHLVQSFVAPCKTQLDVKDYIETLCSIYLDQEAAQTVV